MKYLLDNNANPEVQTSQGNTVVLRAALEPDCKVETIRLLRLYGADLKARNLDNMDLPHIAAMAGNSEIVDYLSKKPRDPSSSSSSSLTATFRTTLSPRHLKANGAECSRG